MSKVDGVEVLSSMSGLSKDTVKDLWEQAKANRIRLNGCSLHDFSERAGRREVMDDYICTKCRGRVSSELKHWYEKGLEHGRRTTE